MADNLISIALETPSEFAEKTISASSKLTEEIIENTPLKGARNYWHVLGPGLTTGAADDDPSGVTTYSQSGAQFGFQFLWLALFTFPLMSVVQEMCARIGLVTGRGLASNIRLHFPRWVIIVTSLLLFMANTINIGADLGAMAQATKLLLPDINFALLVIFFTVLSLFLQIFISYEKYASILKWLALVLLSYVFAALSVNLDLSVILQNTLIPSIQFTKEQAFIVTAILGTTISPYLFFWQTSQEVEEKIAAGQTSIKARQLEVNNKEINNMRIDVWSGMFLSNMVMFFIIAACAATLYSNGITDIKSASDAAEALKPIAGDKAYLLFALGIIGTGLLAVPVLAGSASYALSESFGWKDGLYRRFKDAIAFYSVIILSTIIGLLINFTHLDSIKALLYSAVLNGLIAPAILVLIVLISSNKRVMGNRVNGKLTTVVGWIVVLVMLLAGLATILSIF